MTFDFSSIVEKIKKAYFFFEDKYYALLDAIDQKVPVYRIIDPIDNVFPTFILFIAAFLALFFGLFLVLGQQGSFVATVQVLGPDELPVANLRVNVTLDENTAEFLTDENGSFLVLLKRGEQYATVSIAAEGFEDYEEEILLVSGSNEPILLSRAGPIMFSGPFNITVVDSSGQRITDTDVTARFNCSLSADASPETQTNSNGFFVVSSSKACGNLYASFVAGGYEPKNNVSISRESEEVELEKESSSDSKATIGVFVNDASGNPVSAALVGLFDSEGIKLLEDSTDSSGMVVFGDIEPETYELSVSTDDGRNATKTAAVNAGEEKRVMITLPDIDLNSKKIVLKIIDANSGEPLNDVSANFFANDNPFKAARSDVRGIIIVSVSEIDEEKSFSAVLTHPSYVLKVERGLVVAGGSLDDAQDVKMEKLAADGSNYASVKVFVINDAGAPVSGALVSLFMENYSNPLFESPKIADSNGMVFVSNLPLFVFRVYAQKQSFDGDYSDPFRLSSGATETIIVRLVLGRGAFKAHVSDLQNSPISDATVEFFDLVTSELLDSGKTNSSGYYLSKSFKANKNIYLHITAEGFLPQTIFLPQTTSPYSVIKDVNRDVNVTMYRAIEVDSTKKISFKFGGLFNEDKSPVAILQPNKTYLVKFNMVLPSDSLYNNVTMHFRTGLDSQTTIDTSDSVLKNIIAPLLPAVNLSGETDPANPFSNPSPVPSDSNAKQANVTWQELSAPQVFEIIAKIFVKPGLAPDTPIEIRAKAKAAVDGIDFISDDFAELYKVGHNVCTQNCPTFDWAFQIQDDSGKLSFDAAKKFSLNEGADYNLFYTIYNLSETSFFSASLAASLSTENDALSFGSSTARSQEVFSNSQFPQNTTFVLGEQSPILLRTNREAAFADLNLLLSTTPTITLTDSSNLSRLQFNIVAGKELSVELPETIQKDAVGLTMTIKIMDSETRAAINNAYVLVLPDSDLSVGTGTAGARQAMKVPNSDGEYSISFENGFLATDFVSVKARAPNYRTFYGTVMVTGEFADYPSNFDYSCLKIYADVANLSGTKAIERPSVATTISVLVAANNCPYGSDVSVAVPSYLSGAMQTSPEQGFGTSDSKYFTVTVNNTVPQGKIPLYLSAKFSEDSFRRRLKGASLVVTDPKSCFAMIAPAETLETSTIVETSQSDFEQGTLDKADSQIVPGEISNALIEGSRIVDLGVGGWFAVPSTNKVLVFRYDNPAIKEFETPGVKPESGIAGAGGYFGVVAQDVVYSAKYSDAGPSPTLTRTTAGAKADSTVAVIFVSPNAYFATVVDGERAYVWQPGSTNFDILTLPNVSSASTISTSETYFSVAGDNSSYSWDYRHITSAGSWPLRTYSTQGTKKTSRIAVSGNYFATVGEEKYYSWNAATGAFVQKDVTAITAASRIIPSQTVSGGYFFASGTNRVFSIAVDGSAPKRFTADDVTPESNIVSADYFFAVAATDKTYSGYKAYDGTDPTMKFRSFPTIGTIPNSTIKVNSVSGTKDYFSVIGTGKIYVARFGNDYTSPYFKQHAVSGISPLSPIETPLVSTDDDYFFTTTKDHSYVWRNKASPIDVNTAGTTDYSTIGFDTVTNTFIVTAENIVYLIAETGQKKSIPLSGTSYRSKAASYDGNFIVTGTGQMYSVNNSLRTLTFSNTAGIDIPRYAPVAVYTTKNYPEFGSSASATIVGISWDYDRPLKTDMNAQYSLDNGASWVSVANNEYLYRAAEQIRMRFRLSTASATIAPRLKEITIKYTAQTGASVGNKFDFNINHQADSAILQNKCYGFRDDPRLPSLDVTAGIEPSAIVLRYDPLPKQFPAKLSELYKFPTGCLPSASGDTVECSLNTENAEDTFVSEATIPDCEQHSVARNYKQESFGNKDYFIDAKQPIIITKNVEGTEQDCLDYVFSNLSLFRIKTSFLSSLPADQKIVKLVFYSNGTEVISQHDLYLPTAPWDETKNWDSMPTREADKAGQLAYDAAKNRWEIDITGQYEKWKQNPETNYGFYIISEESLPLLLTDNFPEYSAGSFSFVSSNSATSQKPMIVFGSEREQDIDTAGLLDFTISNNSLVGEENYALMDYNDYLWQNGSIVTALDRFHVQLRASQQQECVMPNNVYGKTGAGALPNVLFSWQWRSTPIDACDETSQNYTYCDSTQFSIELLRKINEIRQLALQGGQQDKIASLLHFKAYLMKDGYGEDFQKDFDHYMRNVTAYNTESLYSDSTFGLYKYFKDPALWNFSSATGFTNSTDKVLKEPGLYQIDFSFDFDGEQFVFFAGTQPSAKINIAMTFVRSPATPNPLYSLPFDGEIGLNKRNDEAASSRQNYGLAYTGAQDVYIVNSPGEEIVQTNSVSSPNAINQLAVSKGASIQALNASDLRGGLLQVNSSSKTLKFLQTNATPVIMEIDSIDTNARGYYKIEKVTDFMTNATEPVVFQDYGTAWTGIYSSMSCFDFAGKKLFYNVPDRNAFSTGENCQDRPSSRGFKWTGSPTSQKVLLRSIFFTPATETYLLKPACSGQTSLVSPNGIAYTTQAGSSITLDFSGQKFSSAASSVSSVFDLVREKKACVSSPAEGELFFWWNPQFLERELLPESNNEFGVSTLIPGTATCPEQGTEIQ